jgi:hypothetical protein
MKPTIALFIHDPKCSVQSGNGIIKALGSHYNFKLFSKAHNSSNSVPRYMLVNKEEEELVF